MVGPYGAGGAGGGEAGRAAGAALCLLLVLGSVAMGQAESWERVDIPEGTNWQDSGWSTSTFPGRSTAFLAADAGGRLYVSNGLKLHIGSQGGSAWKTRTQTAHSVPGNARHALAAGGEGSRDRVAGSTSCSRR